MRCVRVHDARHAIAFNRASFARLMPSMWAEHTEWKNRFWDNGRARQRRCWIYRNSRFLKLKQFCVNEVTVLDQAGEREDGKGLYILF